MVHFRDIFHFGKPIRYFELTFVPVPGTRLWEQYIERVVGQIAEYRKYHSYPDEAVGPLELVDLCRQPLAPEREKKQRDKEIPEKGRVERDHRVEIESGYHIAVEEGVKTAS